VVVDEHFGGPEPADVFSLTKTVVSLTLGVMARHGLLPDLDEPVSRSLAVLGGTPADGQTWRTMLAMTRGAVTDGPWDVDAVTALPGGQVAHIAAAPQRHAAGFAYDDGAFHLLSAAAGALLDEPVSRFAERHLFAPLGITGAEWPTDPDGIPFGYAHLRLTADHLGRLGDLVLDGGRFDDHQLVDAAYLGQMLTRHSPGGPPEERPYGLGIWLDPAGPLGGGWAGQHVLIIPSARAVIVTTGNPAFDPGPPPTDALPPDWRPALDLVRRELVPLLLDAP
jgi:CubicO group peptidase (beta-lactamase class C family)